MRKENSLFDDHGFRPERMERHHEMSEMELRLEVYLNLDFSHSRSRLPPPMLLYVENVLDSVVIPYLN